MIIRVLMKICGAAGRSFQPMWSWQMVGECPEGKLRGRRFWAQEGLGRMRQKGGREDRVS